jgi:predicted CopG family antitoxin
MHKRMTITLDEAVYEGLYRTVGKRRMSQFIEDLLLVEDVAVLREQLAPEI